MYHSEIKPLLAHHGSRRVGPADHFGQARMGPKWSEAPTHPHLTVLFRSASSSRRGWPTARLARLAFARRTLMLLICRVSSSLRRSPGPGSVLSPQSSASPQSSVDSETSEPVRTTYHDAWRVTRSHPIRARPPPLPVGTAALYASMALLPCSCLTWTTLSESSSTFFPTTRAC